MTEACLDSKETNPEEILSEAEHQEVPKEGALRMGHGAES
jgi:hypothetical protein